MDAMICVEPWFQWDSVNHSCLGCIEDGVLHDSCKTCDDYLENERKYIG